MDPITGLLVAVLGAAIAGAVVHFWPSITRWALDSVLPWFDTHLPTLAPAVREVFQAVDNAVVAIRRRVRTAWHAIRGVLLYQLAEFLRVEGAWAVRITSYLREKEKAPYVKLVAEQELSWDELPDEVRSRALRTGMDDTSLNLTDTYEQLLTEAA